MPRSFGDIWCPLVTTAHVRRRWARSPLCLCRAPRAHIGHRDSPGTSHWRSAHPRGNVRRLYPPAGQTSKRPDQTGGPCPSIDRHPSGGETPLPGLAGPPAHSQPLCAVPQAPHGSVSTAHPPPARRPARLRRLTMPDGAESHDHAGTACVLLGLSSASGSGEDPYVGTGDTSSSSSSHGDPGASEPMLLPRLNQRTVSETAATVAATIAAAAAADDEDPTHSGKRRTQVAALPRKEWSLAEDELIRNGVQQLGCKWRVIAAQLPGRSDDAVRNRWSRLQESMRGPEQRPPKPHSAASSGAGPSHSSGAPAADSARQPGSPVKLERKGSADKKERTSWTRAEDDVIVQCVAELGHKWFEIARRLPGRCVGPGPANLRQRACGAGWGRPAARVRQAAVCSFAGRTTRSATAGHGCRASSGSTTPRRDTPQRRRAGARPASAAAPAPLGTRALPCRGPASHPATAPPHSRPAPPATYRRPTARLRRRWEPPPSVSA